MLKAIAQRGPDCFGYTIWGMKAPGSPFLKVVDVKVSEHIHREVNELTLPTSYWHQLVCLVNFRGIPTTEDFGVDSETVQPFTNKRVAVVHNGLLHNDRAMYKKYNWPNITSKEQDVDSYAFIHALDNDQDTGLALLKEVEGSFAIAAFDSARGKLWLARNFRGLFLTADAADYIHPKSLWFASEAEALQDVAHTIPWELPLNSALVFDVSRGNNSSPAEVPLYRLAQRVVSLTDKSSVSSSAIVVLSGGMDSTVCATLACRGGEYERVHLMHFQYGCRAEAQEKKSFMQIVSHLREQYPEVTLTSSIEDLGFIKRLGGSTLTDHSLEVAHGEKGVETDNEWVPARNLVMISLASAYCDRHQIDDIILGLNMEEGSVFADNSIEFYRRMEAALAIGAKSAPKLVMPLGNMMKRHILKKGVEIDAPLRLSWSCYHGDDVRCGTCGPCIMRIQAFRANGLEDMVDYRERS